MNHYLHQNLLHTSPKSSLTHFWILVIKIIIAIVIGILIMMIAMALIMLLTITIRSLSTTIQILSLIIHVLNILLQREIHNVLKINQQIHHCLSLPVRIIVSKSIVTLLSMVALSVEKGSRPDKPGTGGTTTGTLPSTWG